MEKTAIITGACGFLGSHLSNKFLDEGYIVIGIDDFCTSLGRNAPHVIALQKRNRFFLQEFDICDQTKWNELYPFIDDLHDHLNYKGRLCNIILNFACPASPPRYQELPISTLLTCVVGTTNALEFADKSHAIFVQASTSEVYGDALVSPQPETYWGNVNSYGERSTYDEGKRCAEAQVWNYINECDVDARIVRIFNTFGPHMDSFDGRLVSNFICQALRNEPLTIYGDGTQTRSFCYQSDLIEAIWRVSQLPKGKLIGPVNIGNAHEFTINELAYNIIPKCLNKSCEVVHLPLPSDDPKQRRPDLAKAKQVLDGWEAQISIEEGVKLTIPWFKMLLGK
jgi:UDP-glucuronate decarboxylase